MSTKPRCRFDGTQWIPLPQDPTLDAKPSMQLVAEVRAAFIRKGVSLKAWCVENSLHFSSARNCLTGSWDGPAARELRVRILKDSGWKPAA